MDKTVSISTNKKNVLEFDVEVTGAKETGMIVKFVIEANDMQMAFAAKKSKGSTWRANLPPMEMLKEESYPFHISVIVDGYAFEGLRGDIRVVTVGNVKVSRPANTLLDPAPKRNVTKKKPAMEPTKKVSDKDDIVKELVGNKDKTTTTAVAKEIAKKEISKKEAKKKADVIKEIVKASTKKIKVTKEDIVDLSDNIVVDEELADFADLADKWMNRDRYVITEQERKIKRLIRKSLDEEDTNDDTK